MPRLITVPAALIRVSLATAMMYRSNFVMEAVTGLLRTAASVAALLLVYLHRQDVAGWRVEEAMLVMALFLLMNSVVFTVFEPNLGAVVDAIRTGTLDLLLMKPADAQLLVSLRSVATAYVWDAVAAVGIGAWSLSRMAPPSPADVGVSVALLVCGMVAIYGLWLLAICTSFWFVRVDNLRFLLMSVSDAGRWPLPIFAGWVRVLLTVVVPVGVVTSFPAMALRGTWDLRLVAVAAAVALGFAVGSRWAWNRSLAAYTSASS